MAKKNKNKSRRGFTIVELVVALTIIVLVSATAIGVVSVDNRAYAETADMIEATNIAENAIECFRFARRLEYPARTETFEKMFAACFEEGYDLPAPVSQEEYFTYVIVKGDVTVSISITHDFNTITITADNENGNLIKETKYTAK